MSDAKNDKKDQYTPLQKHNPKFIDNLLRMNDRMLERYIAASRRRVGVVIDSPKKRNPR